MNPTTLHSDSKLKALRAFSAFWASNPPHASWIIGPSITTASQAAPTSVATIHHQPLPIQLSRNVFSMENTFETLLKPQSTSTLETILALVELRTAFQLRTPTSPPQKLHRSECVLHGEHANLESTPFMKVFSMENTFHCTSKPPPTETGTAFHCNFRFEIHLPSTKKLNFKTGAVFDSMSFLLHANKKSVRNQLKCVLHGEHIYSNKDAYCLIAHRTPGFGVHIDATKDLSKTKQARCSFVLHGEQRQAERAINFRAGSATGGLRQGSGNVGAASVSKDWKTESVLHGEQIKEMEMK